MSSKAIASLKAGSDGAKIMSDVIGQLPNSPQLPAGVKAWLAEALDGVTLEEFCSWEWRQLNARIWAARDQAPAYTKVFVMTTNLVLALGAAEVLTPIPRH